MSDGFCHPADFPFSAFVDFKAKQAGFWAAPEKSGFRRSCFLAIEKNSLLETGKTFFVRLAAYLYEINFFYFIARVA